MKLLEVEGATLFVNVPISPPTICYFSS